MASSGVDGSGCEVDCHALVGPEVDGCRVLRRDNEGTGESGGGVIVILRRTQLEGFSTPRGSCRFLQVKAAAAGKVLGDSEKSSRIHERETKIVEVNQESWRGNVCPG